MEKKWWKWWLSDSAIFFLIGFLLGTVGFWVMMVLVFTIPGVELAFYPFLLILELIRGFFITSSGQILVPFSLVVFLNGIFYGLISLLIRTVMRRKHVKTKKVPEVSTGRVLFIVAGTITFILFLFMSIPTAPTEADYTCLKAADAEEINYLFSNVNCLREEGNLSVEHCESVIKAENQSVCYFAVAIGLYQQELCSKTNAPEDCLILTRLHNQEGRNELTAEQCAKIDKYTMYGNDQEECFYHVATEIENNTQLCEKTGYRKEECMIDATVNSAHTEADCETMGEPARSKCYWQFAFKLRKPELCTLVANLKWEQGRDDCILLLAADTKDESVCTFFQTASMQQKCINYVVS